MAIIPRHEEARRVRVEFHPGQRLRSRMWALPLACVLFLHAPRAGAGAGGWRVCGVSGGMVAARGTAAGGLRERGCERGVAGGVQESVSLKYEPASEPLHSSVHRVGLLRLRGGRKKGEVEGESGSASEGGSSDDDPMKNEPPPDRVRYTGGVSMPSPKQQTLYPEP